jgi:hypothetical protein
MTGFTHKRLMAALLAGAMALSTQAFAQAEAAAQATATDSASASLPPAQTGADESDNAKTQAANAPAGADEPGLEHGEKNGTSPQAVHSAEATARKTVADPNNQQGKSVSGRTLPDNGAASTTASADTATGTATQ